MKTVKRTERGWIAHFICASRCRFRRNTLLECANQRVVISTVGAMYDHEADKYETVGHDRYYETFVFRAKREQKIYWDAITNKSLRSRLPWFISSIQTDSDLRANEMHEAIVEEFTQKLASGAKL